MKIVHHFANLNDVETLYDLVKKANSKVPMRTSEEVKDSVVLPEASYRHFWLSRGLEQIWKTSMTFENEFWLPNPNQTTVRYYKPSTDFKPMLTNAGLCSICNSPMISDIFENSTVKDFKEVFVEGTQEMEVRSAAMGEYSFIIDTRKRSQYPFRTTDPKDFVRYVFYSEESLSLDTSDINHLQIRYLCLYLGCCIHDFH